VLKVETRENDSIAFKQTVTVVPHRRYLLSGWVKTQNLRFAERDRQGAHLYVWGGHRYSTKNLPSDADWTYYAVVFHSGDRTIVDVAARLGAFAGTVTGTAWFDDLVLVEIPEPAAIKPK
jgi:hypothetical protein